MRSRLRIPSFQAASAQTAECAGPTEPPHDAQDAARGGRSTRVDAVVLTGPPENITLRDRGWKERFDLARDDLIQATGSVDKILGGGRYQITLENDQKVTAQLSGRMRRFRIRVIPGDRVTVGLSPYDPTHGFITFRLKEGQSAPGQ